MFIVIGSIADAPYVQCGYFPPRLLSMSIQCDNVDIVTFALKRRYGEKKTTFLIKALDAHSLALHLISNVRFAALLAKRLVVLWGNTVDDEHDSLALNAAALEMLDTQLPLTARDCLAVSPMCSKDASAVAATCEVALALRLRDPLENTELSQQEAAITGSLGLLTDRACFTNNSRQSDILLHSGCRDDHFYAPATGRYTMSTAQYLLCRMNYGLRELNDSPSWRRREVIVAEYVADLIRGSNTRPLGDLLLHLGMPRDAAKGASFGATLHFKTVDVYIRDKGTDCFDASSDAERAIVVVNAPGLPLGDVVVIMPSVAVIGVCCKSPYCVSGLTFKEKVKGLECSPKTLEALATMPGGEQYFLAE